MAIFEEELTTLQTVEEYEAEVNRQVREICFLKSTRILRLILVIYFL